MGILTGLQAPASLSTGSSAKATPQLQGPQSVVLTATAGDGSKFSQTVVVGIPGQTLSVNLADTGKANTIVLTASPAGVLTLAVDPDGTDFDLKA